MKPFGSAFSLMSLIRRNDSSVSITTVSQCKRFNPRCRHQHTIENFIAGGGARTGEYETYIANHGEDDKRLLIVEPEFANVLKVMAREGNTLSPVIRCGWDSGDLKTMVKNSPAKATKAHISIMGHITRDELRRLLTQTESANVFANRYCWLAVKRSNCLRDGGAIHTVNFDDIIAELQSAVDFAKDFVEIVRDPEATKLWHEIYPQLSDGKLLLILTKRV